MKKTSTIITLILGGIIFGCSPMLYFPSSVDATQQQQLLSGRQSYVSHCGSCHNLQLPEKFNSERWKKQLDTMQVRAKITNEDKQLIFQYLTSQPSKESLQRRK